jgi:hypothetical protein
MTRYQSFFTAHQRIAPSLRLEYNRLIPTGQEKRNGGPYRPVESQLALPASPNRRYTLSIEKMNRRMKWVILGLLVLVIGAVVFIWPPKSADPKFI